MKTLKEIREHWEGKSTCICTVVKNEDSGEYQTVYSMVQTSSTDTYITLFRYFKIGDTWECSVDYEGYWLDAVRIIGGNFNDQLQKIAKNDNTKEKK